MWNLFVLRKVARISRGFSAFRRGWRLERDGWARAGSSILSLLHDDNFTGGRISGKPYVKGAEYRRQLPKQSNLSLGTQWPEMNDDDLQGGQNVNKEGMIPHLRVNSSLGIYNVSWWCTAVICTPTIRMQSWRPVLDRINTVFGQSEMIGLDTGEAIAFMDSEEHAKFLAGIMPLILGEMKISFRRWTPNFNSIPIKNL
ncbi:hypothetical protein FRX31_012440 [Thalictrum thalictroides]|uniref:Uncharacterized protein n=1 Tax=Thalictrum thalictroides TaxID=46969 RepID=A0A7J6WLW4_THATH|nr:hypothetical protein FRX31_012440 [Thalictrum thalictroides]